MESTTHKFNFEQEFNKIWNNADYNKKKKILQEMHAILNRKEAEKQRIKAYFQAIKNENVKAVENMLKNGLNANEKDGELENTALAYAVFTNNLNLVKLLLEYGADPYIENKKGYNSIDAAKVIGNEKMTKLVT